MQNVQPLILPHPTGIFHLCQATQKELRALGWLRCHLEIGLCSVLLDWLSLEFSDDGVQMVEHLRDGE
jgi:hypothetical protein